MAISVSSRVARRVVVERSFVAEVLAIVRQRPSRSISVNAVPVDSITIDSIMVDAVTVAPGVGPIVGQFASIERASIVVPAAVPGEPLVAMFPFNFRCIKPTDVRFQQGMQIAWD